MFYTTYPVSVPNFFLGELVSEHTRNHLNGFQKGRQEAQ